MRTLLSCLTALALVVGVAVAAVPAHAQGTTWSQPNYGGGAG